MDALADSAMEAMCAHTVTELRQDLQLAQSGGWGWAGHNGISGRPATDTIAAAHRRRKGDTRLSSKSRDNHNRIPVIPGQAAVA